jgi:hypothetical protein
MLAQLSTLDRGTPSDYNLKGATHLDFLGRLLYDSEASKLTENGNTLDSSPPPPLC